MLIIISLLDVTIRLVNIGVREASRTCCIIIASFLF